MGTSTPNYGLYKPDSNDNVIVLTDISNNFDIIDAEMKRLSDLASPSNAGAVAWTPTWGANSGTAPSIGNGTLTGRYIEMGKLIRYWIFMKFGTTTSFGSVDNNAWDWTLPFTAKNYASSIGGGAENLWIGSVYGFDAGVANRAGISVISSNSNKVVAVSDGAAFSWSRNLPNVWASGEVITLTGWYEKA